MEAFMSDGATDEKTRAFLHDNFLDWCDKEPVPVHEDFGINLLKIDLAPWDRYGMDGAVCLLKGRDDFNSIFCFELPPGSSSNQMQHIYEEVVYIIEGSGSTTIETPDGQKHSFEWGRNSLFAVPVNSKYQHFNGSGDEPARYLAVTTAPPMMRLLKDDDFIFNNDHLFKGRYSSDESTFSGNGKLYTGRVWDSSFLPNVPDMPLYAWDARGAGGINVMFEMAANTMKGHVSEFPVGTYKKGHRHGPGAHLLILSGDAGYSLTWTKEDMSDVRKADWEVGSMVIVPSDACYHQHFNTGSRRARYLAIGYGAGGNVPGLFAPFSGSGTADVSQKDGGMQVEYEDENPIVLDMFEEDCLKHGAVPTMRSYFPGRKEFKTNLSE